MYNIVIVRDSTKGLIGAEESKTDRRIDITSILSSSLNNHTELDIWSLMLNQVQGDLEKTLMKLRTVSFH